MTDGRTDGLQLTHSTHPIYPHHLPSHTPSHLPLSPLSPQIPDAKLLTDVGTEITFQLPFTGSGFFVGLFEYLDANSEQLGVRSYGMGVTSMEEVFIKVTCRQTDTTLALTLTLPYQSTQPSPTPIFHFPLSSPLPPSICPCSGCRGDENPVHGSRWQDLLD